MDSPLHGQLACVTGAGRGIGRAIALGYGRAGAEVACLARTSDEIERTAHEIRDRGGRALAVPVDVRDVSSVARAFSVVRDSMPGLDLLVVNAGIDGAAQTVEASDPASWRDVIETNLIGAYLCARAAIPLLRARGPGKILLVGSGLGHRGLLETSAYACSKAGLWMLTRVLAQELAPDRISVNELIPGPVETGASTGLVVGTAPNEWLKQPEDVVPLALFLAAAPPAGPTAQSFSLMRREV